MKCSRPAKKHWYVITRGQENIAKIENNKTVSVQILFFTACLLLEMNLYKQVHLFRICKFGAILMVFRF